ncbi:hypothetical protein D3C79_982890 [compost metagenome]
MIRQHSIEGNLRQSIIWGDLRNSRQFVGVQVQPSGITVAAVGQCTLLVDEVPFFNTNLIRFQILEVERVADVGVIDLGE